MATQTQNGRLAKETRIERTPAKTSSAESKTRPAAEQLPMVGWYDPRQLAQTGIEVAISTIFGRHSDQRLVEAVTGAEEAKFYDYTYHYEDNGEDICRPDTSKPRNSIWIDYVGDVGDGWNSTYGVAYYLSEDGRTFRYRDVQGKEVEATTRKGAILVFGGDEVYPTASREEYKRRLIAPYETACRYTHETHPHAFAIPGNHDWYDSLVAFTRLFTSSRWFAGWRTRQSRSYFALKLPHNWWLLGTDVQLGSDVDAPQVAYFESLAEEMKAETAKTGKPASIILCHAEPHWIRAAQYGGEDPAYSESNLKVLEKRLGRDVAVFIAGDLHHYRLQDAMDQSTQKITAGGGGAFMHPTHVGRLGVNLDEIVEKGLDDEEGESRVFKLRGCFPPTKVSQRLCWRNLIFPYLPGNASWTFGFVTAALYLLMTLSVIARIDTPEEHGLVYSPGVVWSTALYSALNSPPTLWLVVLTILGFIFFTDTHSKAYRIIMGGLHALAHIITAFSIALICVSSVAKISTKDWIPASVWVSHWSWAGHVFYLDLRMLLAALLIMFLGFVFGALIMGIYLLLSLNFFGRHGNEAFSSLGIEDWKNFLRLHIDEKGDLTIYPVGIKRVPRKWKPRSGGSGPELVPDDSQATEPELIEPPIIMRKAQTETGVRSGAHPVMQ